jgi:hypothetical protein
MGSSSAVPQQTQVSFTQPSIVTQSMRLSSEEDDDAESSISYLTKHEGYRMSTKNTGKKCSNASSATKTYLGSNTQHTEEK